MSNSNKAYDYLYNAILSNEILPGTPISESDIASKLGISRTPIREALKILDTEGLVKQIRNRGTFVTEITIQDIEEIFTLRELFEIHSLKSAYKFITDETLNHLESQIVSLKEGDDQKRYFDVDEMIHGTIVNHSGNSRLITFRNLINSQIKMLRIISAQDPSHFKRSREQHLEIIKAIKSRDLETAESLLENHIREIKDRTIEVQKYKKFNSQYTLNNS